MALALEYISLTVPMATIRCKHPGGWAQCLTDHSDVRGRRVWHDEHPLPAGAMKPGDIQWLAGPWERRGVQPFDADDGLRRWKDAPVVEPMFAVPALDSERLTIIKRRKSVGLAGIKPGPVDYRDKIFERQCLATPSSAHR